MIFFVCAHIAALLWLGLPAATLALAHAYALACALLGRTLLRSTLGSRISPYPRAIRVVSYALAGLIANACLLGIALHFTTDPTRLGPLLQIAGALSVIAGLLPLALENRDSEGRFNFPSLAESQAIWHRRLTPHALEAGIAFLLCSATILGFNNTPDPSLRKTPYSYGQVETLRPNWGFQGDKGVHLVKVPDLLMMEGLPGKTVSHRGVQLSFLPVALYSGDYAARTFVDGFKTLAFYVWLGLLLVIRATGREIYGLRAGPLAALVVSAVFIGALNYPIFEMRYSTYAGFVKPTLSAFHNMTQLLSLLVGGAGFYFILDALHNRRRLMSLGIFFLGCSFFFKPSFFTVVGPLCVAVGVLWSRSLSREDVLWLLSLCIVPAAWIAYNRIAGGSTTQPLNPAFAPFFLYFPRAAWRFPSWITSNPWFFSATILICSFLFVMLVSAPFARQVAKLRLQRSELRFVLPFLIFFVGAAASLLIVENNYRLTHGNFSWLGHVGYFLALPAFFSLFMRIENSAYRSFAAVVLGLHVLAGVQHLAYFTIEGQIVQDQAIRAAKPRAAADRARPSNPATGRAQARAETRGQR